MEKSREKNNAGDQPKQTLNRGFAAMDPEYQRQIARDGGRIAHERGVAHKWTSEEAREADEKAVRTPRPEPGQSRSRNHWLNISKAGRIKNDRLFFIPGLLFNQYPKQKSYSISFHISSSYILRLFN